MRTRIQGRCALDLRAAAIAWRTLIRRHCRHLVSSPSLPLRRRGRRPVPGTCRTEMRSRLPRDIGSPSPARASRLACHDHSPQPSTSPGLPSLTIGVQLGGSLAGKLSRELASISSRTMLLPRDRSSVLSTDRLLRAFTSMPPRCVSPGLATGTTLRAQRAAVSPIEIVSSAPGTRFGNYSDPPPVIVAAAPEPFEASPTVSKVRWR
jgi:hypothetical protein